MFCWKCGGQTDESPAFVASVPVTQAQTPVIPVQAHVSPQIQRAPKPSKIRTTLLVFIPIVATLGKIKFEI